MGSDRSLMGTPATNGSLDADVCCQPTKSCRPGQQHSQIPFFSPHSLFKLVRILYPAASTVKLLSGLILRHLEYLALRHSGKTYERLSRVKETESLEIIGSSREQDLDVFSEVHCVLRPTITVPDRAFDCPNIEPVDNLHQVAAREGLIELHSFN